MPVRRSGSPTSRRRWSAALQHPARLDQQPAAGALHPRSAICANAAVDPLRGRRQPGRIDLHPAIAFSIVLRRGPDRRGSPVGDPSPLEVPQQPGRELPSVDQGRGTGAETLRLAWAGPTVAVCVRQHPRALSAPSSSDQRARMANRDDQPLRGLEPDHYCRSGLKDAVSHYLLPAGSLTSTAPQAFPNNLTMPVGVSRARSRNRNVGRAVREGGLHRRRPACRPAVGAGPVVPSSPSFSTGSGATNGRPPSLVSRSAPSPQLGSPRSPP